MIAARGSEARRMVQVRAERRAVAPPPPGHAFANQSLTFDAGGGTKALTLTVPRLAGMDDLAIDGAAVSFAGAAIDLPAVTLAAPAAAAGQTLRLASPPTGKPGVRLRRIVVKNMSAPSATANDSLGVSPALVFAAADDAPPGRALHFLIRPANASGGGFGAPAAAVPAYPMPGAGSGLYGNVLGGIGASRDGDTITLTLNPPLEADGVQLFLGANAGDGPNLPTEAAGLSWTADQVTALWQTAPRQLAVKAKLDGQEVPVASVAGEVAAQAAGYDFTPGARSLLARAYKGGGGGDLTLTLEATSGSTGRLDASATAIAARYTRDAAAAAAGADAHGTPIALVGSPITVELPIAAGLAPASFTGAVDGSFGLARLVADADGEPAPARHGLRLDATVWVARRVAVAAHERNRPLVRASIFGRAVATSEVVVTFHRGTETAIGVQVGAPVVFPIDPGATAGGPIWQRAAMTADPTLLPSPATLWAVARATRGAFWWYGHPGDDGVTQSSPDGGGSWQAVSGRPALQLHVQTAEPEPEPLVVRWNGGTLSADLLAAPGSVTVATLTEAQAARARQDPEGRLGAGANAGGGATPAAAGHTAGFHKEGLALFAAADLARIAGLGEPLRLTFQCARDVDMHLSSALFTYDPWSAKEA